MKKFAVAALAISVSLSLIGCGLLDLTESKSADISVSVPSTLQKGTRTGVTGEISAPDEIASVEITVQTSSGTSVSKSQIEVEYQTISGVKSFKFKDEDRIYIKVASSAQAGDYKLVVSVTDINNSNTTLSFNFTVGGGSTGTQVVEGTFTLGAHDHATVGSSVDLDNGQVMLAAAARAANSGVDIVYTYSSKVSSPVLMTPVYAKNESGITAFANWVNPNDTKFHKVSADYDDITTKEEIESLFDASKVVSDGRLQVSAGDVVVVKTDEGAYVLVEIVTVSSNASGTANFKYAK